MHISWLGTTAIKLQTKHEGNDITIVIDAYKPDTGTFPRSLTPDIGLYTRGEKETITLSGKPFTLSQAGECETKGVLMTAIDGKNEGEIVIRIDAEQISLGHLGRISEMPPQSTLDMLSGVDVLFVPVDSKHALSPDLALKVINNVEPRIVIPMAFKSDNDPKADTIDAFMKEIGANEEPEKKIILKKKDLPQEDMLVMLLEKE